MVSRKGGSSVGVGKTDSLACVLAAASIAAKAVGVDAVNAVSVWDVPSVKGPKQADVPSARALMRVKR